MTKTASKWLKSLTVTDSDIARGKNILKTEVLDASDNSVCMLESLQQQALFKGQVCTPESLISNIDKLSASDVKAVRILRT